MIFLYRATKYGYTVWARHDSGKPMNTYKAGNYTLESSTVVSPKAQFAVPEQTLRKWAKQTALEMAHEHRTDPSRVIELRPHETIAHACMRTRKET